jgi:hypothetical protein
VGFSPDPRMIKPTSRLTLTAPFVLLLAVACGDAGAAAGTGGGGQATGGGAVATAGSATTTVGGSGNTAGGLSVVPLAGSGQAIGGGDQGSLFPPSGSVPIMPPDTAGTGSGGGAPVIPGDGHVAKSTLGGSIQGNATFTQKGEDVTLVVNLTGGCADGNHQFRIHDGDSCDSASTEGAPWTPRGTGLGPDAGIACSGGKGTLTYTRNGDDKTKNLTVSDHNPDTDLTIHVVIVSDEKDPNSRASCGNFFF